MLRIIGGDWRGRRIRTPAAETVRPTSDRVREAVFNLLGQRLDGQRVLDLFAGSGALGLEALSRGADEATFVERDVKVAAVIKRNLAELGAEARARVVVADAAPYIAHGGAGPYDTVFADPPYRQLPEDALWLTLVRRLLADGGRLVIEHAARRAPKLEDAALVVDSRRYGDTAVTLVTALRP